jgi:CHASE1-domain containing sensor protein
MDNIDKKETSRDRFKRLATQRTNTVLQRLKVLGNCSNRSVYEYDEEDITKIFSEIERRIKETKAKFHYPIRRAFKL